MKQAVLARGPRAVCLVLLLGTVLLGPAKAPGQQADSPPARPENEEPPQAPEKVEVNPRARDEEIEARLGRILKATGWFSEPQVSVREGIVFLQGQTRTEQHRKWAGDLARSTQDVVATVNKIEVREPPLWDFAPALAGLRAVGRSTVRALPWVVFTLVVLVVSAVSGRLVTSALRPLLLPWLDSPLLARVGAWLGGLLVFLVGLYIVLQVAGLTRLALTVIGGTGLLGLVLGIAFRDITENFLASIFLSLQHPFSTGDLIELAGVLGYVQRMTVRSTVLMTLEGNHVQIPNAVVYKEVLRNYTSNPRRRENFTLSIGDGVPVPSVQEAIRRVLAEHPAVLDEPEPWVLVEGLSGSSIGLRVYFWLDGSRHSWLKVRSSVIRLTRRALREAGVTFPDPARELIFPAGVPVRILTEEARDGTSQAPPRVLLPARSAEPAVVSTSSEAGLVSEAGEINEQGARSRGPEEEVNLLRGRDTP